MLKYQESILLSKSNAEEVSKSGDLKAICNMLIGLHHVDDFEWAQDFLLSHLSVDSLDVNRSAIYGLASLARVYRKIDRDKFRDAVSKMPSERRSFLAGAIQDAIEDFDIFISN
ncbi:hypothetical protein ACPRNU_18765 [Chromobacterium vaccinii]|uniref:hypothetical protein n=1 Tax=Chromobacterium vaccinii TaxID=1108595 RepID=UPI003C738163